MASPFSNDARLQFEQLLSNQVEAHQRRVRPTPEVYEKIRGFLVGSRKQESQQDYRLKFDAFQRFQLRDGKLFSITAGSGTGYYVPRDSEVFDIVVNTHLLLVHAGRDKTFQKVDEQNFGITRVEVRSNLEHCSTCVKKLIQKSKPPLKPIVETELWSRVQVDLIDMTGNADGQFKWICHIRDHFSKYSVATAMRSKSSEEVAAVFQTWIIHLGIPRKLHCDNGTEFKGAFKNLLTSYGVKIIHGRPHHPQSQGMIEKANGILKEKIGSWMSDHQSSSWVKALPDAIIATNMQRSSVTRQSPYEIVFGQRANATIGPSPEADTVVVIEDDSTRATGSLDETTSEGLSSESGMETPRIIEPTPPAVIGLVPIYDQIPQASVNDVWTDENNNLPHHNAIRQEAQVATSRSVTAMLARNERQNPISSIPYRIGQIVTLRIPKKNRLASQSKRLLCKVLEEPYTNQYKLLSEHGLLRGLFPRSELDTTPTTIPFVEKSSSVTEEANNQRRQLELTLNAVSRLERDHFKSTVCYSIHL